MAVPFAAGPSDDPGTDIIMVEPMGDDSVRDWGKQIDWLQNDGVLE